jgi:hypothetical protein
MYLAEGVYLSEASDPPPFVTHCMIHTPYSLTQGGGDRSTSEKSRGALVHKGSKIST